MNMKNGDKEPMVRLAVTVEQRQIDWLRKRKIYSPSRILQDAIDQLMRNEKKLMEK
jgi:hypothetical protein